MRLRCNRAQTTTMRALHHRLRITVSTTLLGMAVTAQNLVVNSGFETYSALPTTYAQMCLATGWSSANGSCTLVVGCGSPEYYHTSATGGVKPPATYWATVMPHSGGGMAGFAPWYLSSPAFREYLRTTLSAPLVVGQTYEVGFWVTNATSTIHPYGINHFGVAFSTAPLTQSCGAQIVYTPQVEYPGVLYSTNWQYVSLLFTPTQPFQYVCIGNFVPFASTTYQSFGGPGSSGSYYYIDDVVVQPSATLPVELLSFSARASGRDAMLEWSTATELNNERFDVQRSIDGTDWTTVGSQPGAGTSQERHDYALLDALPPLGVDYYRLAQIDLDGEVRYSRIESLSFQEPDGALAWPQPCDGEFTLRTDPALGLSITDPLGRPVAFTSRPWSQDAVRISILRPATGVYLVRALGSPLLARVVIR